MGAPLLVFLPLKAQLLLPFAGLGLLISLAFTMVSFPKYNESAVAGFTGTIPGTLNAVPFGMMGMEESDNCGYNIFICSSPSTDFSLVYSRSFSNPARSLLISFRNSWIFRLLQGSGL